MKVKKFRVKGRPDDATFLLDKGQCSHGALFHAVPGCCKCSQQCRIAGIARVGTLVSYQTLLKPCTCNTLGQCGTMLHGDTVPSPKEQSCIVWTDLYRVHIQSISKTFDK